MFFYSIQCRILLTGRFFNVCVSFFSLKEINRLSFVAFYENLINSSQEYVEQINVLKLFCKKSFIFTDYLEHKPTGQRLLFAIFPSQFLISSLEEVTGDEDLCRIFFGITEIKMRNPGMTFLEQLKCG